MKNIIILLLLTSFVSFGQTNLVDIINDATAPLDEADKAGATVMALNADMNYYVIKEGSNNMICLADNPEQKSFNVACYHKSLEPFMARGRALKKEGKTIGEIEEIREAEAVEGKLVMPREPATLYVLSGETKENANLRWVVYIPWATAESTGLPLKPMVAGGPWIMFPNKHNAHIMITPPSN